VGGVIRIGPAGWSYVDWKGLVYPQPQRPGFDPLRYLADFFDTIEINSTFYRPALPNVARSWTRRVSHNPDFKFTVKLHRNFTHDRQLTGVIDHDTVRSSLDPFVETSRLGALLLQFPWSFKNCAANRDYLAALLELFQDYPQVVELRHASWNRPAVYQSLTRRSVALCNIDQPVFADSIGPSAITTSPVGYIRLHGRNYENWFKEGAGVTERYDYLYSPEELREWIVNIREVAKRARDTYVIANNHFRGQAIVNALEIKAALFGEKVRGPLSLLAEYPRLSDSLFSGEEV
jgi:uncharacterized protein YecE (DUF72 family)